MVERVAPLGATLSSSPAAQRCTARGPPVGLNGLALPICSPYHVWHLVEWFGGRANGFVLRSAVRISLVAFFCVKMWQTSRKSEHYYSSGGDRSNQAATPTPPRQGRLVAGWWRGVWGCSRVADLGRYFAIILVLWDILGPQYFYKNFIPSRVLGTQYFYNIFTFFLQMVRSILGTSGPTIFTFHFSAWRPLDFPCVGVGL